MPYNTRRKSLSLPSLGIHVPVSNAARAAAAALANRQRSPTALSTSSSHSASSTTSSSSDSSPTFSPRSPTERSDLHAQAPAPRATKRPHALVDSNASHRSSSANKRRQTVSNTPPPSPGFERAFSIEMEDLDDDFHAADNDIDLSRIHDEIVSKVIVRLQATHNRPHIVKELAGILLTQLKIVQQSANPCAIISSRLSAFIKRPSWNVKNPCPLGKELETVHPRRTYFYLTTSPHQPLPDPSAQAALKARELPTPSASSGSDVDEDDRRRELSPSPELDLEPYRLHDDIDDEDEPMPATPLGSYPSRHSISTQASAAEPPLETDEKEFTQTANGLQKRKLSGQFMPYSGPPTEPPAHPTAGVAVDEHAKDDTLFGDAKALDAPISTQHTLGTPATAPLQLLNSPHIHPATRPVLGAPFSLGFGKANSDHETFYSQLDSQLGWDRSPEQVDLDELDSLLNGFYAQDSILQTSA